MADEQNQYKVISKKNAGFPAYLDFDKLRREGIDYLGRLSGKLWTDHNVHDPGITVMEMLCYALLDLGYRTNLPVSDILARNPEITTPDDNFLTPAQILANNPLTITDYRKLLIDIPGVKNAWLEIVKDYNVENFCRGNDPAVTAVPANTRGDDPCCDSYVNGLYRVYLDLENSLYTDISKNELDTRKKTDLLDTVRKALLSHRNLCEDFVDIFILCKLEVGVCADIELEENADPEQVYLKMAEALYQFFSPAPRFYTLPQLLEKGKTIDEIFSGRPPGIIESHGFIDVEELEQLPLRKEIHLSDAYNVLLSISGIKRVQNLRLRKCSGPDFMSVQSWKFLLPHNHVPEFSIKCSGFRFLRYGVPVSFNFEQYQALIELNTIQMGKVLFKAPSPYLDNEIPKGIYRADLDQYYSIQNEFPRVYGIGEGGLADNVPVKRKAQALQLKGYLLFFDQLLANYLSQLRNLRGLFSMGAPQGGAPRASYFINELNTVPDLDKLLRFTASDAAMQGALLSLPVHRKELLDKIEAEDWCNIEIENAPHYHFDSLDKCVIAVSQVRDDFYHGNYEVKIVTKDDECVFYYIITSSDCFVLLGNKYFRNEAEARLASETLTYVGGFEENFRTFINAGSDQASFDIEFNLSDYKKYLQLIAEDPALYRQRRQSFLDHLLARFAERFTDFALLSYDQFTQQRLGDKEIVAKENYLATYPKLSANRGKAYDYLVDGWNNYNISGFEDKFMALSGIKNRKRHSLCNFEVAKYDEKYVFNLNLAGQLIFTSDQTYNSKEEAREGIRSLLQSLQKEEAYRVDHNIEDHKHFISLEYSPGRRAVLTEKFDTPEAGWQVVSNLRRMFANDIADADVVEDTYKYTPRLTDFEGNVVMLYNNSAIAEDEAKNTALKSIGKTSDRKLWTPVEGREVPAVKLSYDPKANDIIFVDTDVFKTDVNNTIVGKPDKYTYELLDRNHSFKFRSVKEFDSEKAAKDDYSRLLHLLAVDENFHTERDKSGKYKVNIKDGDTVVAESFGEFDSEQSARSAKAEIKSIINKHLYRVAVDKQPATWKFTYDMGYKPGEAFRFRSAEAFNTREEAKEAAIQFNRSAAGFSLQRQGRKTALLTTAGAGRLPSLELPEAENASDAEAELSRKRLEALVGVQKEIAALLHTAQPAALDRFIDIDDVSKTGLYVYRLVDKDNRYAVSTYSDKDEAAVKKYRNDIVPVNPANYNSLNLYVKGDITNKRQDETTKAYWYHYQLRSVNAINSAKSGSTETKPLVLFESTKGYETQEEAEKAFAENYFPILRLATQMDSYRNRKIVTTELLIHNTLAISEQDPIVFVPQDTIDFLGEYEEKALEALIKVVNSYPLRIIYPKADCEKFTALFNACDEEGCKKEDKPDCSNKKEKPVWYFVLFNKATGHEDWISVKYYATAAEAWKDYEFFLVLLKYPGNYYIDCTCDKQPDIRFPNLVAVSTYKIFIREVLAESAGRFTTEEHAWSPKGVQQFIDVAQTKGGFHTYLNRKNCCYSFYVACPNTRLYHPCKYDTPDQRDRAATLLHRSVQVLTTWRWEPYCRDQASTTLKDFEGKNIATVTYEMPDAVINEPTYFGWYTEIMKRIATYGLCIEGDKLYLKGKSISFTPVNGNSEADVKNLKEQLARLAQFYPFSSKTSGTGNNKRIKYCLEIKLPGFSSAASVDDCQDANSGKNYCWVAWKSDCCFDDCFEIIQAFRQAILLLSNFSNYKPIFDCTCHSYGIALHFENLLSDGECGYLDAQQQRIVLPCENAIIAYNPQCYSSADMACYAVDRAKLLINSEGLQVVEHILLRPQCVEDCHCRQHPCVNEFGKCDFPSWKRPTEDPCDEEKPVCFKPGYDPYSFIATVVLPAWPQRFRNKDNRQLLENILYREAPAHVLLRIIWLAPHDFCCFEKQYKQWVKWLGIKKHCVDFSLCDFQRFLFDQPFECLIDPHTCEACPDSQPDPSPCLTLRLPTNLPKLSEQLLSQVNTNFCWRDQHCNDYKFIPCEPQIQQPGVIGREVIAQPQVIAAPAQPARMAENVVEERPAVGEAERSGPVSRSSGESGLVHRSLSEGGLDKASKSKFINSRFSRYRKEADAIVSETKGMKAAAMVRRFLDNQQPSAAEFRKLVEEVIKARDDKKNRQLTKKRAEALLAAATQYFIDKWAFNGKEIQQLEQAAPAFDTMRGNKVDMFDIYRRWESDALKKHEPALDMNQVKYLLTGNK